MVMVSSFVRKGPSIMKIHLSKLNLRNHLTVIILASLIILLQSSQVVGQEVEGSDSAIIVLDHEQSDFWMVDAFTGERDLIFSHDVELGQILDFVVNMDQSTIFVLEGPGCCGGLVAGDSRISRVNWHTGEVDGVLEQRNMVGLDRIPGSEQLLLTYYPPEEESISIAARDGLERQCSLDMESYICANPLEVSEYWGIIWLSEDRFIGRVGNHIAIGMTST
ncbi:hypothetical protein HC928_04930 [bacterium]|nr:hypothetical protein [bacterium]